MSSPFHVDSVSVPLAIDAAVGGYVNAGNSGAAITIDFRLGKTQLITLTASAPVITLGHVPSGARELKLILAQDATGSRLMPTFAGTTVNYGTAGAPTLTTTASKRDILTFITYDGGATLLFISAVKGF